MIKRKEKSVTVILDGRERTLPGGVSVAAGLLAIGEIISRISPASQNRAHRTASWEYAMSV